MGYEGFDCTISSLRVVLAVAVLTQITVLAAPVPLNLSTRAPLGDDVVLNIRAKQKVAKLGPPGSDSKPLTPLVVHGSITSRRTGRNSATSTPNSIRFYSPNSVRLYRPNKRPGEALSAYMSVA